MNKYTDVFFDMDNTIWDFDTSSKYALSQIYEIYKLSRFFDNFDQFYQIYKQINSQLWDKYRKKEIKKETLSVVRFLYVLEKKGVVNTKLAEQLSASYLAKMTEKPFLEPYCCEVIRYLREKKYRIHILSDGFFEVQIIKVKMAKIANLISNLIVSEEIGVLKPDKRIFDYAIEKSRANKQTSIFVGDDFENDIKGAANAGLDQVFYNKKKIDISHEDFNPTFHIFSLEQIKDIL